MAHSIPRVLLLLTVVLLVASASPRRAAALPPVPFAPPHDFVAIADRPVCSLLAPDGNGARVEGEDGSASVVSSGRVFWTFGDSFVGISTPPPNAPNGLGYSATPATDPAADCITMQQKRDGSNTALPLLPKQPGECSVWSSGLASLAANLVHLFYIPVTNCSPVSGPGIGLAKFDPTQPPSFPSSRLGIVWPSSLGLVDGAHPLTNGAPDGYFYIALHGPSLDPNGAPLANTVRLARVPATAASLEACVPYDAAACPLQYWDAANVAWRNSPTFSQTLFTTPLGMNGGIAFAFNDALQKWIATYATGPLLDVRARSAALRTGAWSADEMLLSYCPYFFLPGFGYCYTGATHPEYDTNGGNTIYLTMSTNNTPPEGIVEYSPFLHELTLGKPVVQSANASAHRYTIGGPPAGYSAEGTAFYAAAVPIPGFAAIYEWSDATGDMLLSPAQPDATHNARGTLRFYSPPRATVSNYANAYEPVYRWDGASGDHVYSPLLAVGASGYANKGIAFYTVCGDTDQDLLSDCAELNSGNDPQNANYNVDGDVLLDANGNPVVNTYGQQVPLGNAQSVAQDNSVRRQDIDNCPLVNNPYQENTDSGDIPTGDPSAPDVTRPNSDIFGDACDQDHDNDGLTDAQEAQGCNGSGSTDPHSPDSDGDHFTDRYECLAGSNPNDASSIPPGGPDTDGDGVPNALEAFLGTDPQNPDTDGDGVSDFTEAARWATDPLQPDTDGDGCGDGTEIASVDGNWTADARDLMLVSAHMPPAAYNVAFDIDRNGVIDHADLALVAQNFGRCIPPRHIDRPQSQYGVAPPDPARCIDSANYDPNADPDGDGLTNAAEVALGTNRCFADTDADSCPDGKESGADRLRGGQRDPLSPWDFFDVPTPPLRAASPNGARTHSVTLSDVIAILYYIGTVDGGGANANGVSYATDWNANGIKDGQEYDRTGSGDASQPWRSRAPNGSVSISDAIVALAQAGADCS